MALARLEISKEQEIIVADARHVCKASQYDIHI